MLALLIDLTKNYVRTLGREVKMVEKDTSIINYHNRKE